MALPNIHVVYRFWFLWLDPALLVVTVYALVFHPKERLDASIPSPLSRYMNLGLRERFLTHKLACLYAFKAVIMGGVLRISKEISVWRAVVTAVLVVDITMFASDYASVEQLGGLSLSDMRSADWRNNLLTGIATAIQVCFLAGVGVQDVNPKKAWDLG